MKQKNLFHLLMDGFVASQISLVTGKKDVRMKFHLVHFSILLDRVSYYALLLLPCNKLLVSFKMKIKKCFLFYLSGKKQNMCNNIKIIVASTENKQTKINIEIFIRLKTQNIWLDFT